MPKDLRETSLGFYRAWHAALGTRHGFFLALRDAALAPDTLADELGFDRGAVARWCEGAWALGLLSNARGKYRLTAAHRETLGEPTSPEYLGHHFHYLVQKSLTFGALDNAFRGKPTRVDLTDVYAIATSYDHVASLAALPTAVRRALDKGADVLDLGAGKGGWTRAAMQAFPASRFTAADLDTRALRGLSAKGARVLDARKLPAAAFDLVYMGEVLAAAKDIEAPLRSAARALRPGGHLVLVEGIRPAGVPRDWGERLVLAMGLDFAMDGSEFATLTELRAAARKAGFLKVTAKDLGGSLFLAHARKPQTASAR